MHDGLWYLEYIGPNAWCVGTDMVYQIYLYLEIKNNVIIIINRVVLLSGSNLLFEWMEELVNGGCV